MKVNTDISFVQQRSQLSYLLSPLIGQPPRKKHAQQVQAQEVRQDKPFSEQTVNNIQAKQFATIFFSQRPPRNRCITNFRIQHDKFYICFQFIQSQEASQYQFETFNMNFTLEECQNLQQFQASGTFALRRHTTNQSLVFDQNQQHQDTDGAIFTFPIKFYVFQSTMQIILLFQQEQGQFFLSKFNQLIIQSQRLLDIAQCSTEKSALKSSENEAPFPQSYQCLVCRNSQSFEYAEISVQQLSKKNFLKVLLNNGQLLEILELIEGPAQKATSYRTKHNFEKYCSKNNVSSKATTFCAFRGKNAQLQAIMNTKDFHTLLQNFIYLQKGSSRLTNKIYNKLQYQKTDPYDTNPLINNQAMQLSIKSFVIPSSQ